MKSNLALALTAALTAYSAIKVSNSGTKDTIPPGVYKMYKEWKKDHRNGLLQSPSEDNYRLGVFYQNYLTVTNINTKQSSFVLGMNQFADMTDEEIISKYTGLDIKEDDLKNHQKNSEKSTILKNLKDAPSSKDWIKEGVLGPVKDQSRCGACWAFSANSVIEASYYIKYKKIISLSEQQLNDCSHEFLNKGCEGGLPRNAFMYGINQGVAKSSRIPYLGRDSVCTYDYSMKDLDLSKFEDISRGEDSLKAAVGNHMPVSVGIYSNPILRYKSGIYNDLKACPARGLNHAVTVVGYGSQNGQDFWYIRNSWGKYWGDNGYMKMARSSSGDGICGIALIPSIARVE